MQVNCILPIRLFTYLRRLSKRYAADNRFSNCKNLAVLARILANLAILAVLENLPLRYKDTRNVDTENKRIIKIQKAEREAAKLPPSCSDRWQANFFIKSLRSPIPITVCRSTCNEREARSSPRKRQGCCRECSLFFAITVIFFKIQFLVSLTK